jgi:hypothetical protein
MLKKYTEIIEHFDVNIKSLERTLRVYLFEIGREMMRMILEGYDAQILSEIDPGVFKNKGLKKTSLRTLFGSVEFQRRLYEIDGEEEKTSVFLLDSVLGLNEIGKISTCLLERIVNLTSEISYEKAAKNISEETGEYISGTTLWNVTQKYGQRIRDIQEKEKEKLKEKKEPAGEKKKPEVLFVETDGIHINLQGDDREKHGKKKEMKVAVTYEGWAKRYESNREVFVTKGKQAIAGFEDIEEFALTLEARIRRHYAYDDIGTLVLGGDGGNWIKKVLGDRAYHFQLDKFHLEKKITKSITDKESRKEIHKLVEEGEIDSAVKRLEQEKYDCGGEEKEVEKIKELQNYLKENRHGLIPWQERKTISVGKAPEGIEYRNLGTMEHHVCDLIRLRMKKNKTNWSVEGANNMAALRCKKLTEGLQTESNGADNTGLPERYQDIFEVVIDNKFNMRTKKSGKTHEVKHGGMPFRGEANTPYRKAVRAMIERSGMRF